jgi:hypothetical protein
VLRIAGRNQRRLSREAPRVVKLKDWNGATRSHRPLNPVALAWFANAAMHDRIEEYARRSDAMATPIRTTSISAGRKGPNAFSVRSCPRTMQRVSKKVGFTVSFDHIGEVMRAEMKLQPGI